MLGCIPASSHYDLFMNELFIDLSNPCLHLLVLSTFITMAASSRSLIPII